MSDQPSPVITTLDTASWPEDWYPSAMRAFAKRARAAGWEARVAFNRGYVQGQAAGSWDLRDMISVWLDGYGRRAVAFWERNPEAQFTAAKLEKGIKPGEIPSGMMWTFQHGSVILGNGKSFPWMNADQTAEWVKLQGAVLPSWYAEVREKYFLAQEATKARARNTAEAKAKSAADAAHASAVTA